ncbi:MAG: DUF4013 domain-containing protein [Phycisphaera sp.]|nr:DUF4013 domain-containing protein [Phycisphaera sp.]
MSETVAESTNTHVVEVARMADGPLDLTEDVAESRAEAYAAGGSDWVGPVTDAAAEVITGGGADAGEGEAKPRRGVRDWIRLLYRWTASAIDWLFGAVTMIVTLAVLATIPVLNLLSLGYLLSVSGRVAASGRLRDGFPLIRRASVIGRIVICSGLLLLPVRFVSDLWESARLIDASSVNTTAWRVALILLTTLTVWHITWAIIRGGRVRHFLWPAPRRFVRWLRTPGKYATMRDKVYDFVVALDLPGYFWLGARGFVATVIWLIAPVAVLMAAMSTAPDQGGGLLAFVGIVMLAFVVLYLPFLQCHFAAENRFGAMFEWRTVRRMFNRAPIAWWAALLIMLLFALPLYLLKIELTPAEVAWLPSLVFVMFIFPARLLAGWAVGRARLREEPRHGFFRWAARLGFVPVVMAYALIVYGTQFVSWYGTLSILEQHAFLVPAPMLGFGH